MLSANVAVTSHQGIVIPLLYVVSHDANIATTGKDADIALESGSAGLFVIDTTGQSNTLWPAAEAPRKRFPKV